MYNTFPEASPRGTALSFAFEDTARPSRERAWRLKCTVHVCSALHWQELCHLTVAFVSGHLVTWHFPLVQGCEKKPLVLIYKAWYCTKSGFYHTLLDVTMDAGDVFGTFYLTACRCAFVIGFSCLLCRAAL